MHAERGADDTPARRPDRRLRARLPDAGRRAPEAVDLSRRPAETKDALRARRPEVPRSSARCACWPAGWSSAGVRFVQLYCGAGSQWDAHGDLEGNHAQALRPRATSRSPALITDLKRAGAARRHARHLGRRVRPHADDREGRRPRPQPLRLHHVPGRRRGEGRARPTARPTSSASTPSRTGSTSTTSTPRSCTCWASTTNASPSATTAATSASRSTAARSSARSSPERPGRAGDVSGRALASRVVARPDISLRVDSDLPVIRFTRLVSPRRRARPRARQAPASVPVFPSRPPPWEGVSE